MNDQHVKWSDILAARAARQRREPELQEGEYDVMTDNMYKDALAVMETLPALFRETRRVSGLSLREIAPQVGLPESTLSRFERESFGIGYPSVVKILRWMTAHHER